MEREVILRKKKFDKEYGEYLLRQINGKLFFIWNEAVNREWYGFFERVSPISFTTVNQGTYKDDGYNFKDGKEISFNKQKVSGYLKPVFNLISVVIDTDEYNSILNKYGIKEGQKIELSIVTSITDYRDLLFKQMERQLNELNNLLSEIVGVLKHYYHLVEEENEGKQHEVISQISDFYLSVQAGMGYDQFQKSNYIDWINSPQNLKSGIVQMTINGLRELMKIRQPVLDTSNKIAKDIYVLESIIEDNILNGQISSYEHFNASLQGTSIEKIVEIAISSKVKPENKLHASEFLKNYGELKCDIPDQKVSFYLERIGYTDYSDVTYRRWIENYENIESALN